MRRPIRPSLVVFFAVAAAGYLAAAASPLAPAGTVVPMNQSTGTAIDDMVQHYQQEALQAKTQAGALTAPFAAELQQAGTHENQRLQAIGGASTDKPPSTSLVIFVSFSMPDDSLVAILRDANKVGASVAVRGLIDNSMKATVMKIAALVQKAGTGGVDINPLWFTRYHIDRVPAVVIAKPNFRCLPSESCVEPFDVVFGNVPLAASLRVFQDKGSPYSQTVATVALTSYGRMK